MLIAFRAAHFGRITYFIFLLDYMYFSLQRVANPTRALVHFLNLFQCVHLYMFEFVFVLRCEWTFIRAQCKITMSSIHMYVYQCFNPPRIHMDVGIICVSSYAPTNMSITDNEKIVSFAFFSLCCTQSVFKCDSFTLLKIKLYLESFTILRTN